jgi:hypothetical protein
MSHTTSRTSLAIAATLATLLVLSACGGGGDGGGGSTQAAATLPQGSTPAPAPVEIALAPGYTAIASAVTFSKPNWPEWGQTGTGAVDGVACYVSGGNYHVHALLSIYRDGVRLALPGSIGRNSACDYELHTHEGSGTIHVETDVPKTFTLGQFFSLWGQNLSDASVAGLPGKPSYFVIENEQITRVTTNPADITLTAHKEVVIVTGTPPREVPKYSWGSSGL